MAAVSKLYFEVEPILAPHGFGQHADLQWFAGTVTWGADTETYTTGGLAVAANDLKVSALSTILVFLSEYGAMESTTKRDVQCRFDRQNSKFMLYDLAGVESGAGDVGAYISRIMYLGKPVQDG
jgi:hypothetical protein